MLSGCMVPLAAIEKGQVRTVELPVTKTTMDNKDVFTLIPVVITINGQTTVQQIPLWSKYKTVTIWYGYKNKIYKVTSDKFKVETTGGHDRLQIAEQDIGKAKANVILYKVDKR